ncbi:MAG: hypothetical protein ACR2PW_05620 [Gammaproteobacteria bacterium]
MGPHHSRHHRAAIQDLVFNGVAVRYRDWIEEFHPQQTITKALHNVAGDL